MTCLPRAWAFAQSCFVGPLPLELQLFELPVQLCKLLTRCLQILEELDLEVVVSLGTNSPAVHFNLHLADRLEQVGPLAFQVHLRLRDATPQTIGGGSRYFILLSLPRVAKLARELRPAVELCPWPREPAIAISTEKRAKEEKFFRGMSSLLEGNEFPKSK